MNEQRLKESKVEINEELLSQLHDIMPFAIILIDSDGSILYRSREFENLVGYTAEDVPSENEWWLLAYPEEKYRERVKRAWKKEINRAIRENDKPKPQEWVVTCKDGSKKDIEFTTVIVGDKILVTLEDITKNKKTEESLKLAEYMIENVSDMVFLLSPERHFLYVNQAAINNLGYTREQLLSMCPADINLEYTLDKWEEHWKKLQDVRAISLQSVFKAKDGHEFPVEIRANLLEYEGRTYIFTFVRDITDRARTEEGLRLTQFAVDHAPDAIYWINQDAKFLYANIEASRYLGYSREELLTMSVFDIDIDFTPDVWAAHWQDIKQHGSVTVETRHKAKDGNITFIEISANYVDFAGKEYNCAFARDITERKRAEEALKQEKALTDAIFNSVPGNLYLINEQGYFVRWNKRFEDIWTFPLEDITRIPVKDLPWADDSRSKALAAMDKILKEGYGETEASFFVDKGIKRTYFYTGVRLILDDKPYIVGIGIDVTERRLAEDAMRREMAVTQAIFDSVPGYLYLFDEQGHFVRWNKKFEETWDFTIGDILQVSVMELPWTSDSKSKVKAALEQIFTNGYMEVEASILIEGETERTFLLTGVKLIIDDKPYVVGVGIDITERKQAEEALQREKALTDAILDSVPGTLFVIDDQGHFVRWNKKFEEATTFSPEEIPYMTPVQDVPWTGDSQSKAQAVIEQVLSQGYSEAELSFIARDGEEKLFFFTTVRMIVDNKPHIVGIGTDITERKRIEEDLAITNEELRILNRIIAETTSVADLQVILDMAVEEATRIVGLEGSLVYLIRPDDTFELAAHRAISDETAAEIEKEAIKVGDHPCGVCAKTSVPLILSTRQEVYEHVEKVILKEEYIRFLAAFPLMAEAECAGVLCVFTRTDKKPAKRNLDLLETATKQVAAAIKRAKLFDEVKRNAEILEQRVIERTLQLENVNKELESFSYSVSHDLRNPLRAIDGFSMILIEDYSDKVDAEVLNYLTRIRAAAIRMDALINDILRLSRVSRAEMTRSSIDLSEIAQTIATSLMESQPERKVEFIIEPGLIAYADANLIRIALENLFDNAWKFTSKQDTARIEFGAIREEGKIIYYVKDNGVGFDQAYVNKLFVAFQRLHSEAEFPGTGVGLATVKRIISRHGGEVWAVGEVDKGATFYFTLPNGVPTGTGE